MPKKPRTSRQTRLVLSALLSDSSRWRHGYDISVETGLKSGTLYPLLIRLEDQGFLTARWSEPERVGRPARHEYRLTTDGCVWASEQAAAETAPFGSLIKGEALT